VSFLLILLCGLHFTGESQEKRCLDHLKQYNKATIEQLTKSGANFNKWRKSNTRGASLEFEIPVVVHVLYNTNAQNISTAKIQSQIDVLNEDYNKQNKWNNTIADFIGIVGDAKITFTLVTQDPQGNYTTGIT
jgi:hypothetical protein